MTKLSKNIVLISGGVGGAKLAEGLNALRNINLSIIGNIADDEEFHGLRVSPDIDTLTYTLSGMINRDQGWGLQDDTYNSLSMLKKLGQKTMRIRKSDPARRRSFRARHNCANPGPKTKARYWSCRKW